METPGNQTLAYLDLTIDFAGKRHIHIRNNTAEARWPYGAYQFWISLRPVPAVDPRTLDNDITGVAVTPNLWSNGPLPIHSQIWTAYPHIISKICATVGNTNMVTCSQRQKQLD